MPFHGRCLKFLIQINKCNFQEGLQVDLLLLRPNSPLGKHLNPKSALSACCWRKAMFWVLGPGGSVHLLVQPEHVRVCARTRACVLVRACACVCVCECWCVDTDNWTLISSGSTENSRSPSKQLISSSHEYPAS